MKSWKKKEKVIKQEEGLAAIEAVPSARVGIAYAQTAEKKCPTKKALNAQRLSARPVSTLW